MQFFPKSLRLRVAAYVFTTSLLVILLIGSLIFSQIRIVIETIAKENLLEQAQKIASFIEYDWIGNFDLDFPRRMKDYYSEDSSSQYAVLNSSGKVLFSSKNFIKSRIQETLKESGKHYFNFSTPNGKNYIGLKYDYLFENKIYPVYVIEEEAEFSKFLRGLETEFLINILAFGIPPLLLQAIFILFIFRQTFQPIIKASMDAKKIKYENLSLRLDEKDIPTEIMPLIRSVNNGLARLEKSAETQKFFIANAAHELRTPISILKARIASLKDEKEVYLLNEDLRNINRLISQMLDISRLDLAESAEKTQVSLNDLTKKACEDIGALFVRDEKELSLEELEKNQIIYGNEDTLFRAVLNLLENALKHTTYKTPVEVIVDAKKIIIRDYGPVIPEDKKSKLFERFEKLPDSIHTKGSGLGLAIVKKAAEIHGGSIKILTRRDGNDFILDFS